MLFRSVMSATKASTRARAAKRLVLSRFKGVRVAAGRRKTIVLRIAPAAFARMQAAGLGRVRTVVWINLRTKRAGSTAVSVPLWLHITRSTPGGITG